MPFPGYNIHLVNEAYGIPPGWLQSSLYRSVSETCPARMSEILERKLRLKLGNSSLQTPGFGGAKALDGQPSQL